MEQGAADAAAGSAHRAGGTIRRRVARILALPAVVILALLGVVAAEQVQGYRTSQTTARSVDLALAVQDLVSRLAAERGVTAAVLGGNPSFRNELPGARRLVNEQRAAVQRLVTGGEGVETREAGALQQLDGLAAVRAATDAGTAGRQATFAYYTDRIAALSALDLGLDRASDGQLRRGASTLLALQDLAEAVAQERAFLNGVFSAGGFAKGEFVQFASMRAARDAGVARFQRFATEAEKSAAEVVFGTGAARGAIAFEQVALDAADGRRIVVNPQTWWSELTTVLDDLHQLQRHVGSEIQLRAHDLQQTSAQRLIALLIVVVATFAGSIYLSTLASLSITRPLAALAAEANSVAAERLPAAVSRAQVGASGDEPPPPPAPVQVPPRATAEIRSVATALERLQTAAFGLATEQALQRRRTIESLANLGRRNQNLIRRQLGFITALEHEEIDPSALANLFELDHLATRMRRNASSLLVLVGASSPRQWSSAVPVADVIRAAVSEVEEYRRVTLRRVEDSLVVGTGVGSVAHLLSELIENGLTFSPPDCEVEIQGRRLIDGYLIAITDQGVGMSAEDLRQANRRLRGEEDFITAPTRFLGHFVVGQLASLTGMQVELLPSPVAGVTARVTLPASLLAAPLAVEARLTPPAVAGPRHATGPLPLAETPARHNGPRALPPVASGTGTIPAASGTHPVPAASGSYPVPAASGTGTGPVPAGRPEPRPSGPTISLVPPPTEDPDPPRPTLPPALANMLSRHPLVHTFAGDLTVTAPNDGYRKPSDRQPLPNTTTSAGSRGGGVGGAAAGPPPATVDDATAARTRNGLRKRLPRDARPASASQTPPPRRVIDIGAAERPAVDDSPEEVRARLTALRTGLQRGHMAGAVTHGRGSVSKQDVEDSE